LNGIDVSGGGAPIRHVLTTSDVFLTLYLIELFGVEYTKEISYESSKNKVVLSSQIPLEMYKHYIHAAASSDLKDLKKHINLYKNKKFVEVNKNI